MPTQKPLRNMLPELKEFIEENRDRLDYNARLMRVHDGQLHPEVVASLSKEFTTSTVKKLEHRIPCINFLTRIVDKLSKIYSDPVKRTAQNSTDAKIINSFESKFELDDTMNFANKMYNLHQYCAIEPFLDMKGNPRLRVVSADKFLVYSDDPTDRTNPTVYIKFMGDTDRVMDESSITRDGIFNPASEDARVQYAYVYSDDEFLVMDTDGNLRDDLKPIDQNGKNELGQLPIVYLNQSPNRLLPLPDTDMLENVVLLPKMLADLNMAVKHLSHTILVAKDLILPETIQANPDSVISVSSVNADDGKQGSLDVLTPKVDVDGVLKLAQSILATWLEAKNLRPGTMGNATATSRVSALAKIVDEADNTAERRIQTVKFSIIEKRLFELLKDYQKLWVSVPGYKGNKATFSENFEVSIIFPDQKLMTTEKQRIEESVMLVNAGLATRRQALKKIYPTMTEVELDAWVKELDSEPSSEIEQEPSKISQEANIQEES